MGMPLKWDMVGLRPERPKVELRPATGDDGPTLLAWRNDPETRRASTVSGQVSEAEHSAWLAHSLASDDRALFIASLNQTSIGTCRIDRGPANTWEVSITVAPEHRGQHLATALLMALEEVAYARGIRMLTARIRSDNAASIAAFKNAGYYAFVERSVDGARWSFCERRTGS
jgi:RimJ/RimL family protein N-acetyltransferase